MKVILTVTATLITIMSTSADAWWGNNNRNNWNNNNWNNNNWDNRGYYDGNYDGSGKTSGDGKIDFHADFKVKMKMRNRGNSRIDAYNYGNWGNESWNNTYSNSQYNNRYAPYYGGAQQQYYAPFRLLP